LIAVLVAGAWAQFRFGERHVHYDRRRSAGAAARRWSLDWQGRRRGATPTARPARRLVAACPVTLFLA
jgi:hypothetical protein